MTTVQQEARGILLPPELQSQIMKHCSPKELASLMRVNSSFKAESEKALYETVTLWTEKPDFVTKSSAVARKAELVRTLLIHVIPSDSEDYLPDLLATCEHLLLMVNLLDLRIMIQPGLKDHVRDRITHALDTTLRKCSFRLKTLFCNPYLDIPSLVQQHEETLHLLAFCVWGYDAYQPILEKIQQSFCASNPLASIIKRIAIIVDCCHSWHRLFNTISLFPAFNVVGEVPLLIALQDLIFPAIGKFSLASSLRLSYSSYFYEIRLFYRDVSQMSWSLASDVVTSRSQVTYLHDGNGLKLRCLQAAYPDLTPLVTHLPSLRTISFCYFAFNLENNFSAEVPHSSRLLGRRDLADQCRFVCPQLSSLGFWDQSKGPGVEMEWKDEGGWLETSYS